MYLNVDHFPSTCKILDLTSCNANEIKEKINAVSSILINSHKNPVGVRDSAMSEEEAEHRRWRKARAMEESLLQA